MKMRIPIREQLTLLILFCCLVCVAVLSVAVWITNLNFVTGISSSSLILTASLYAQQLSSSLFLLQSSVQSVSTRVLIQSALIRYENGNNTDANWVRAGQDLQTALFGGGSSQYLLQARVYPSNTTGLNGATPVMNVTGSFDPIQLPYSVNGTPVSLGDTDTGYPPALYPNLTYTEAPYNSTYNVSQAAYNGALLNTTTPLFLGPWPVNSSFSLCSITYPIVNNTSSIDALGWITIVASANLLQSVETSTLGLGDSGVLLIVGPDETSNLFPPDIVFTSPQQASSDVLGAQKARFVYDPFQNASRSLRHPSSVEGASFTFNLSQYVAAQDALTGQQDTAHNAGSFLDTYNEAGDHVSVGFAWAGSDVVHWAVIVEQAYSEVVQPITNLRNVLLACLFGTTGVVLLFCFPVAHYSVRPIRRLRVATMKTVDPYMYPSSSELGEHQTSHSGSEGEEDQYTAMARKEGLGSRVSGWFSSKREPRRLRRERATSPGRRFRIPGKVEDHRHVVNDELSDLSSTFNEMVEELRMQYTRLEERVKERTHELELSKRAAEAANESKTLFIANISHELKTPLNGILGMCAVCMSEDDPTKIRRSLGIIYKSGDLLLNLLTDLLTFSKNQIGQQLSLDEKEFRLADIRTQILSIFDKQTREAGILLRVHFEGPSDSLDTASGRPGQSGFGPFGTGRVKDMCLWGDHHRILQVLINLVSNSLKFTPAGGSVTVTIRCIGDYEPERSIYEGERGASATRKSSTNSRASRVSFHKMISNASESPRSRARPRAPQAQGSGTSVPSQAGVRSPSERNMHTALDINSRKPKTLPQVLVREHSDGDGPGGGGSAGGSGFFNARTFVFDFEVEDTGPGIPPAQQQKVFEPFVQGDLGLSKKYGGTGLGLSICSQLATLMKGDIQLHSVVGTGSTFTMRIPLTFIKERAGSTASSNIGGSARNSLVLGSPKDDAPPPLHGVRPSESDSDLSVASSPHQAGSSQGPPAPAPGSPPPTKSFESPPASKPRLVGLSQPFFATSPPLEPSKAQLEAMERVAAEASRSGAKIRVLVAEDNKVNQEVVLRMLKLEDIYDVTVAKDGQEALDLVKESMASQNLFNLVFMDIQMPNLDGLQSTRRIRDLGFSAPIVALTAFADESNARECIDSGMDYFLPKPIKRPALKQVLKRYCTTIPEEKEGEGAGSAKSLKSAKTSPDLRKDGTGGLAALEEGDGAPPEEEKEKRVNGETTKAPPPIPETNGSVESSHTDTHTSASSVQDTAAQTSPEETADKIGSVH